MKKPIPLSARLRYAFDNSVSRGTAAMIGWLGVAAFSIIFVVALLVWATQIAPADQDVTPDADGLLHSIWMGLMRAMDAGTVAGDKGSIAFLFFMMVFTIAGIFLVSILIGLLTSGVEAKIDELRKGRSLVLEQEHILLLGWSSKIFTVIQQLCLANQSHPKPRIVILADKDKVEMEDEIASRVGDTGRVRIICRTGSPIDVGDLAIVNPDGARTIAILPPEDDDPDAQVIKVILALVNNPHRTRSRYHIVAELHDRRNVDVVKMISRGEVEAIESPGLIARIMVQTSRQAGLSTIYSELLDFGGSEIYFREEPSLVGRPFHDTITAFEESVVLGLRRQDGQVKLLPPFGEVIQKGDALIVLAEDDSAIRMTGINEAGIDRSAIVQRPHAPNAPERTLVLGWNRRGPIIVSEMDKYVAPGSSLRVVSTFGELEETLKRILPQLTNLSVSFSEDDTTDRAVLDALEVPSYDHVILLSYGDDIDTQRADARSIITLLHLRDISEKSGKRFSIVSEILDVRNRALAEVTRADDFIVSDNLVSLMMSQIAESKDLNAVFEDLFDPEGAEIYLKPVTDYVKPGVDISIRTLVAATRDRNELFLGYRKASGPVKGSIGYGLSLNPPKGRRETFSPDDQVVILSEQ